MSDAASKIVILGASGQVGRALKELLGERALPLDRAGGADLAQPDALIALLDGLAAKTPGGFAAVINAAAYTAVDQAEKEEPLARIVNADAPAAVARWCAKRGIPFVSYSTDYVFDGQGTRPWTEQDPTGPLGAYGRTKLEGERKIAEAGGKWLVFRTSWVYDATGKNFLRTMLRLGSEREQLKVVGDQFGAPTYAPHLARATLTALENAGKQPRFPSGIYHLCNAGVTTWHAFADAIFKAAKDRGFRVAVHELLAIRTEEYPTPARRPFNSRMSTEQAFRVLGTRLPSWEEGLRECMEIFKP